MIDKHSETWRKIATWAEGELSRATERIETLGVKPEETENLRGRIAVLRDLLTMQDETKQRVVEARQDYGFMDAGDTG